MDKQLAAYFFDEVSRAFAFLVDQHSFAPPQLEVDDKFNLATVIFLGRNVAVECQLEEREGDVECKIARVSKGMKSPHYGVDEHGVRVREGLSSLLRRRGVRDKMFQQVGGLELRERIRVTLGDYVRMLKTYGQDILNDSPAALA